MVGKGAGMAVDVLNQDRLYYNKETKESDTVDRIHLFEQTVELLSAAPPPPQALPLLSTKQLLLVPTATN